MGLADEVGTRTDAAGRRAWMQMDSREEARGSRRSEALVRVGRMLCGEASDGAIGPASRRSLNSTAEAAS